jgi:hypothetical protein
MVSLFGYYVEKLDCVCGGGDFVRPLLSDKCVCYFDLITILRLLLLFSNSARLSILDGHLHRTVNMKDRSSLPSYVAVL